MKRESFQDEKITVPADRLAALDGILNKAGIDAAKSEVMLQQATRNGWFTTNKFTADAIRPLLSGPGIIYTVIDPTVFSESGRRIRLDPMLDPEGNLLPSMITPINPRPANLPADAQWNDGSQLQYLKPFAPFKYGVTPVAIGWNYAKRCQVLRDVTHQRHLQLSDAVMDNRPAIDAKLWGEGEWEMGRRMEALALGKEIPKADNIDVARAAVEGLTADIAPQTPVTNRADAEEAIYDYDMVVKISATAIQEFNRHKLHYLGNDFRNNRDSVDAMSALCAADADYLRIMLLAESDPTRASLLKRTIDEYTNAMLLWEKMMLAHYTSDGVANAVFPAWHVTRDTVDTLPPDKIHKLVFVVQQFVQQNPRFDTEADRFEAERSFGRAYKRLQKLDAAPNLQ